MRIALLLAVLGCADLADPVLVDPSVSPDEPDVPGDIHHKPPGEQEQGRFLLGEGTDLLGGGKAGSHISVKRLLPTQPTTLSNITSIRAVNGELVAYQGTSPRFSGDSSQFTTMEIDSTNGGVRLRILGVTSNPTRYVLGVVNGTGVTDYCKDGKGAIAIAGTWQTSGLHEPDNTAITFGCQDGTIRKCFTFGYHPPDFEANADSPIDPWTAHQACTRMTRADYCSNGGTHTLDETSIVIRDRYPGVGQPEIDNPNVPPLRTPTVDPAPPDQYWFEAIWRGGSKPVKCLEKVRWKSLPLGGPCPGTLDDPRTVPGASYCEELQNDDLVDAIMWNSSKVGQLYLHRWTRGAEQLVTVRGAPGTTGRASEEPYPGYQYAIHQVGLLRRNPPGSLLPGVQLDALDMQLKITVFSTDRVVTLADDVETDTHVTTGFEGYVYVDNIDDPKRLELKLYKNGSDFVSSTSAPTSNFTFIKSLGYIDPNPPQ